MEILSEKLFDGLAGIYGAGAADDFVERVISKMTKSAGGQRVLRMFASGLGEAGEEVISGLIDPALKAIVDGQGVFSSTHYNADTRADIAHSALVASILGGLGGAVALAGENSRSAKAAREENSIAENRGSAYSNGKENASPMNHDPAPKGEPFVEEPGYMYLGTMDHIMEVADSFPKSFQSLLQNGWLEASNEEAMKFGYHTLEEKETGLRIRFDEGRIGENGFRGRDHYHIFNPYATGNSDLYLDANGVPTNKKGKHSHILPKGD